MGPNVFQFLGQCNDRIIKYKVEIEDLADFMGELNRRNIKLDVFFDTFRERYRAH